MITTKISGRNKIIFKSEDVRELMRKLEELAHTYLCTLQVQDEKYYKKSESKRWGKVPAGYFMVSKYDKIIIYHKYISLGYIYNSTVVDKIISYSLIRPTPRDNNIIVLDSILYGINCEAIDIKIRLWADIHKNIIKDENPAN
jgi:hypothetical protein